MTMRKIISILLAFALCLGTTVALAAQPITITSTNINSDGSVTIRWNNPNGGKVTVGSLVMDDGQAGNRINVEFDVAGSAYTYYDLAPGREYALLVFPDVDLDNAGVEYVNLPAITRRFDEIHFEVQDANLAYFTLKNGSYSYNYAKNLTNREILNMLDEKEFWVKVDFNHVAFSYDQYFQSLTVVTSPTGYVATAAQTIEIPAYTTGFWQAMVYMNDALLNMHEANGQIPTGKYTVEVYLDGTFAGDSYFYIK